MIVIVNAIIVIVIIVVVVILVVILNLRHFSVPYKSHVMENSLNTIVIPHQIRNNQVNWSFPVSDQNPRGHAEETAWRYGGNR